MGWRTWADNAEGDRREHQQGPEHLSLPKAICTNGAVGVVIIKGARGIDKSTGSPLN